jgi:hypothetical protein
MSRWIEEKRKRGREKKWIEEERGREGGERRMSRMNRWRRRRTGVGEGGVEEGRDRDMRSRRMRGEAVEGKRGGQAWKGMEEGNGGAEDKANEGVKDRGMR